MIDRILKVFFFDKIHSPAKIINKMSYGLKHLIKFTIVSKSSQFVNK